MQKRAVFVSAVRRVVSLSLVVDEDIMGGVITEEYWLPDRPAAKGRPMIIMKGKGQRQTHVYNKEVGCIYII